MARSSSSSKASTSSAGPSSTGFLQQTTSVCDLGSTPTADTESTMGKTGRKTFKTDKKKKEAVWPDYVERWLIQGWLRYFSWIEFSLNALKAIEEYTPPQSRSGRGKLDLVRFPCRNKYISEFIYANTGKYRTAKQVGSRIQQLRQTCRDPKSEYIRPC
jgi:TEA/ATTS domain